MDFHTFFTAFAASFAFLLFLSGEIVSRSYERARLHYSAIVDLDFALVRLLNGLPPAQAWLSTLEEFKADGGTNRDGDTANMLI